MLLSFWADAGVSLGVLPSGVIVVWALAWADARVLSVVAWAGVLPVVAWAGVSPVVAWAGALALLIVLFGVEHEMRDSAMRRARRRDKNFLFIFVLLYIG